MHSKQRSIVSLMFLLGAQLSAVSVAGAQTPSWERVVSIGINNIDGGTVLNRRGAVLDVQLRRQRNLSSKGAVHLGGGFGGILGGTTDGCVVREDGSCGSRGNFAYGNLGVGASGGWKQVTVVGSADFVFSRYEERAAVGPSARLDFTTRDRRDIRPGLMLRVANLKASGNPSLLFTTVAVSMHF